MKRLLLLIIGIIPIIACSNSDESEQANFVDASEIVHLGQTLEVSLGAIPTEGNTEITKQASNFILSEIQYQEEGLVYVYKAKEGFDGNDYVEITQLSSIGDKAANQKTVFRISIAVTGE